MIVNDIVINKDLRLVNPRPKKDSRVTVGWLEGDIGRQTLRFMGCLVEEDFNPSIKEETKRLRAMLKSKSAVIKMIEYQGQIIGQIEIWLKQYDRVASPSISILIGSPNMRGQKIGSLILGAIHDIIRNLGYERSYGRALMASSLSNEFFIKNGYLRNGRPYGDDDGLLWQNYVTTLAQELNYERPGATKLDNLNDKKMFRPSQFLRNLYN
ncbi:GNAT family N-acetyltransferase [Candidatus Saccharibacteria bacterium]|nr:GNAT family N-acetyltransferase [Candidatus Saccharibacteria bacterium]